jgi:hypothetical protein
MKIMALIKTDYEEGRLQPTQAGHPAGNPTFPHDILKNKKIKKIHRN